jgi:peptide/nickel transport system ATP-binding protein
MSAALLSVQDLRVAFRMGRVDGVVQRAQAVGRDEQGVSFELAENSTVALVGESGSGKSVTAMSILNLLPDNAERIRAASCGAGATCCRPHLRSCSALRGREIACVFQDPMSSLNPVLSIGRQLTEPLRRHLGLGRRRRCSAPRRCWPKSA